MVGPHVTRIAPHPRLWRVVAAARVGEGKRVEELKATLRSALGEFPRVPVSRPGLRRAAVAITVVTGEDARPCFLLTRRAARMRTHAGQWALPGGRLDDGEGPEQAARRELHEELGLNLPGSSALGLLDDYASRSGYVITPVVLWAGFRPTLRPQAAEVARVYSVPLADLDVEPRLVRIPESDAPVIQLPLLGRLIHAPTAAVLYQFRELALHGRHTRVAHFEQPVFAWQ